MSLDDMDILLHVSQDYAKRMLTPHGEFYPFSATMSIEGRQSFLAYRDPKRQLTAGEIREHTLTMLREQAREGKIRAASFCMLARVVPKGSTEERPAIYVEVEDSEGQAVDVYLVYDWRGPGDVTWGTEVGGPGSPTVFSRPP